MRTPRTPRSAIVLMTVLCGLFGLLAGCGPLADIGTGAPGATGPAGGPVDRAAALSQLDTLAVAPWGSMAHYSRDRFPHWISQGQGCDTRDKVLERDGQGVTATSTCTITKGTWVSPYDGKTTTDPQDLDIDHLVPLANAWRTGAAGWTDAKREQFANDLTRPQLLAVTASTNRSKGDQDPSQWKPPNHAFWCTYAANWITVKSYWQLTVTAAEKDALAGMLQGC